jgi:hypothetical protein
MKRKNALLSTVTIPWKSKIASWNQKHSNLKILLYTVKNHNSTRMRVDSTCLRVDRIDTHLRHTNPTTLRVESTRDFLLCNLLEKFTIQSSSTFCHQRHQTFIFSNFSNFRFIYAEAFFERVSLFRPGLYRFELATDEMNS